MPLGSNRYIRCERLRRTSARSASGNPEPRKLRQVRAPPLLREGGDLLTAFRICAKRVNSAFPTRCYNVTDRSLCSMSDFLWLEYLDLNSCSKISDEGIEVLASICTGLEHLDLTNCHRLSDATVRSLIRYCRSLRSVSLVGCSFITEKAVQSLTSRNVTVKT